MSIKAIIFDMDGVLIDARDWHFEALNRALALFGKEISRYDHLVTFDGLPTRKKLELLSQAGELPLGLHGVINRLKQQFTIEMVHSRCRPVFHHQYALSRLKREGFKLAVCSNSIRSTVETMMEKSDLARFLDFYLSNEDVLHSKPDPEMYNLAMKKLGLHPDECLIVEDNENGIRAAQATGAHLMRVACPDNVDYFSIRETLAEYH